MQYTELHCKTNFSFLEGASHADELFQRAAELGYHGLAITDRNSLAGIVRAHTASKDSGLRLIVGAELHPIDGPPLVVWPQDLASYARLCRLISRGRLRREKGSCGLSWGDVCDLGQGLLAGLLLRQPVPDETPEADKLFFEDQIAFPWEFQDDQHPEACSSTAIEHVSPSLARNTAFPEWLNSQSSSGSIEIPSLDFRPSSDAGWLAWLNFFHTVFGDRGYLLSQLNRGVDDRAKLARLNRLSRQSRVPLVASGDVHYHCAERSILFDCLLATRLNSTIDQVASERLPNSQYYLRARAQIASLYSEYPEAIERTQEIANRIRFSLDDLRYQYPTELAPEGKTPIQHLKELTWIGAKKRYPEGVPDRVVELLRHEISLIEELRYEAYFLTVWDLVRFARSRGILCQGRGSAANSVVCYCLGITSVDPNRLDLLFERFISRERNEAPDIDVDFEHQRREEVLQYIYGKYGRHRAGMTATVITYRIRSAIRDAGRALGISLDRIDGLSKLIDARLAEGSLSQRAAEAGIDPSSEVGRRFLYLVENLVGFPRHLSQHVGGMVITEGWLCELCPLENASMDGRTVIQWDKDDLDELGILKVDCLSLGMLSAIHRCFDLIEKHHGRKLSLATVPPEDSAVYEMICQADTIGVFQIESRAQMSMLPRLRPRCFYDLVIEVAIVRPGPIQGQMVHPYLTARRTGLHPDYPTDAIRKVLEKTMGVPIFQEQAMRLAVVAAGFSPGEADLLRRAMAAWRRPGLIDQFRRKLIDGMLRNGLTQQFADQVFTQIRGFGEYGFPESHAASFALLVYVSCWLKHYYPDAFCAALLNSQPMGFYAPAQLIQDAENHGVAMAPVDVNSSFWDSSLEVPSGRSSPANSHSQDLPTHSAYPHTRSGGQEPGRDAQPGCSDLPPLDRRTERRQLRVGLHMIRGLQREHGETIVKQRLEGGSYQDVSDLTRRCLLPQSVIGRLADAGALGSLSGNRRAAYWQALGQQRMPTDHSLLEACGVDFDEDVPDELGCMEEVEEVYADYESTGFSLRAHPMSFVRSQLNRSRVTTSRALKQVRDGSFVKLAGLVLIRQRPSTAKGITFVTLEDEFGSMNLVIKPNTWQRHYKVARQSNAWLVHGIVENRENLIHVLVGRIDDLTQHVQGLSSRSRDFH